MSGVQVAAASTMTVRMEAAAFGFSGLRAKERARLEHAEHLANVEANRAERAWENARGSEDLLQRAYDGRERDRKLAFKDAYLTAPTRTAAVDHARIMLRKWPQIAVWGVTHVFEMALAAVTDEHDPEHAGDYRNRVDMWGIGIVEPPKF